MATTKVLILKPVENLGGEGEQVTVKAGYARNFLFPKKVAIPVNKANKKQIRTGNDGNKGGKSLGNKGGKR